jgi:uncharacterized protein with PhoU and TrkA domain
MDFKKLRDFLARFSQRSAELAREGAERLTEKATAFSVINKAKMEKKSLEHRLDEAMVELGGEFYHLYTEQNLEQMDEALKPPLEKIRELRKKIIEKEIEIQKLYEKYYPQGIDKEKISVLKEELERGGGTIEQIVIGEKSPVIGKKLKSVKLPKEVLVGTILRQDKVIIPDGSFAFEKGDYITLLGKKADVEEAIRIFNPPEEKQTS